MKKLAIVGLVSALSLAALVGCGSSMNVHTNFSSTETESTTSTKANGTVINPQADEIDVTNLKNGTYNVDFSKSDIIKEEGGLMMENVKVFTEDVYSQSDMDALKLGDTIVSGGEKMLVQSIERNSDGEILINGGFDEDGLTLVSDKEAGGFVSVGFDDERTFSEIGTTELEISPDVEYTDSSDLDNKVTAGNSDLLEKMDDSSIDYNHINTTVTTKDAVVVAIDRAYMA